MEFESLCEYTTKEDPKICTSGKVPNAFKSFFKDYKPQKLAISLSGGVDSMVCSWVLAQLLPKCDLHAIHINYGNRDSCNNEVRFVTWWCQKINIRLHVFTMPLVRVDYMKSNRNHYEKTTQLLRFKAYKDLLCPIVLGHNYDDVVENVITNIASSKNKDNLYGMSTLSVLHDVSICRPMLKVSKKDIINYAKHTNVSYLKDSTPSWSRRGKLRDVLIPTLNSVEPSFIKNLMNICAN